MVVGGLGSPTDGSDAGFFRAVLGDLIEDPRFRLIRFGVSEGSYDTTGAISRNGDELRRVIRRRSTECQAIHVLAHSMGGAVADRALSKGDPASDGVVTYVALASPHNGATGARAIRPAVEANPLFATALSATTSAVGIHDPTSDAVRDLAQPLAPLPLRDIEAVRLRLVTDEFVLRRDNMDRRVDVREYLPTSISQIEGHGQIVHNETVQQIVRATIATHHAPAEERSWRELGDAARASIATDAALAGLEDQARIGLVAAAIAAQSVFAPLSAALSIAAQTK